ncbi:MAG: pyridoxal-phosphate dependent enzyme [Proteobacteria bacterium]|nr:pyridoxal-phosphate dependent enzyme [Pseudomonadota bacterium]
MENVHQNILSCIGQTPIVQLNSVTAELRAQVYAKLEYLNPGASVKDRIALKTIEDAEQSGQLRPGGTIVEATSGNTGAGLAIAAGIKGYKCLFVLPDKQSEEKRAALRAYGAKVIVTPTDLSIDDPRSYLAVAKKIAEETPNAFFANQYENQSNTEAHYASTGPEIWEQMGGELDVFVAGLGTGGTISGVGRYLKEQNPDIRIVGVDPVGSVYYDYFHTGQMTQPFTYLIEDIGEGFLPSTLDFACLDDVVRINDKECFHMTRRLAREEGLFAGGSSGAAVVAAMQYMRHNDGPDQKVLVLLGDSGSRYVSKIYNDKWMEEQGFLEPAIGLGNVAQIVEALGSRELITIPYDMKTTEAIGIMKMHGISQIPVMKKGSLLGIIQERALLEHALRTERVVSRAEDLCDSSFCTVNLETPVSVVSEMLRKVRVALIMDNAGLIGVLTRIDILEHVARVTGSS